jgi:SAM-dependent methyltransferase
MLPEVPTIDYLSRWRDIVERRRQQMDAAYANAGIDSGDYWARRAKTYREAMHARADDDPFLARVLPRVTAQTNILDVGAGTGRHTIALAPHVARVTAVEPSAAMLGFLREDASAQGLANVQTVPAEWMAATVAPHDVVLCSHVLYPIAEIEPFVRKLALHAGQRVFIYTRVDPLPTDFGLWAEFHGEALQGQPSHMDVLNALAQMDIYPDVDIVQHRFTWTFASLDEAVEHVRNSLALNDDDEASTARLRALLDDRLARGEDGRLGPEVRSARTAVISWAPADGA